jgi:hypothetical protein
MMITFSFDAIEFPRGTVTKQHVEDDRRLFTSYLSDLQLTDMLPNWVKMHAVKLAYTAREEAIMSVVQELIMYVLCLI